MVTKAMICVFILAALLEIGTAQSCCPAGGVGFNVALSTPQSGVGTIKFNVVKSNQGSGWDSGTWKFIAPCDGLYSFQISILNSDDKFAWAQMMKGTTILQKVWADGHNKWHLSTAAAVVRLNKGDSVLCRLLGGSVLGNVNQWTNFVGFLIQSDCCKNCGCPSGGVGFNVALSTPQSGAGTIKFNVVKSNQGSGWNNLLKIFIAPCDGLYSFHISIMNSDNKIAWAQMMKGTTILQKVWADSHNKWHLATAAAVVRLNKGDSVLCRLMAGSVLGNNNQWTNFVGFLISA